MNIPPSWGRMNAHQRAVYLCNARLARDYPDARRKVGQMEREARESVAGLKAYQERMEKLKLA